MSQLKSPYLLNWELWNRIRAETLCSEFWFLKGEGYSQINAVTSCMIYDWVGRLWNNTRSAHLLFVSVATLKYEFSLHIAMTHLEENSIGGNFLTAWHFHTKRVSVKSAKRCYCHYNQTCLKIHWQSCCHSSDQITHQSTGLFCLLRRTRLLF